MERIELSHLSSRTATRSCCSCFLKSTISTFTLSFNAMSLWSCWTFSSSVFHWTWLPLTVFEGSSFDRCGLGGSGGFLETIVLISLSGFIVIISISQFVFVLFASLFLFSQSVRRWTRLILLGSPRIEMPALSHRADPSRSNNKFSSSSVCFETIEARN